MAKFKVGDRVRVHYSSIHPSKNLYELRGYGNDEPAVVSKIDKDDSLLKYFVKFDKPLNSSDLRLWVSEDELEPLAPIPDGWTPADEPPSDPEHLYFSEYITINARDEVVSGAHDLKTITELSFVDAHNEGEYVGVYRKVGDTSPSGIMGQVEPERKADPRVRYCVAADLPTSITVWHDTFEAADAEAQRLCVKCGKPFRVLKVVEEVKPGEPVITKLEE